MSNAYHYDREAQWYANQKPNKPSGNVGGGSNTGSNNGLWFKEDNDRVGISSPGGTPSYGSSGGSYGSSGGYSPPKPKPINPYTGTSEGYGTEWITGEDYYQKMKAEAEAKGGNFIGVGTARDSDYINLNAVNDAKRAGYYQYLEQNQGTGRDYGANGSNVRPDPYINPTLNGEGYINKVSNWQLQDQMEILKQAEAEARRAGELATESAVMQLEGNRDKINQQAEAQAQQEYIKYMLGGKNLNESMAMQGINGGMAESSMLEHQANYQNNQYNITQTQSNALNDLDRDIAIMRANGDLQGAQIAAEYQLKMADAAARNNELLFQQLEAEKNYQLQLRQMNQSNQQQMIDNQYRQQSFDYGVSQDNRNWDYTTGRDAIEDKRYDDKWALQSQNMGLENKYLEAQIASMLAKQGGSTSSRSTGGSTSVAASGWTGNTGTSQASQLTNQDYQDAMLYRLLYNRANGYK